MNGWAWYLVIMNLIVIITAPALVGRERKPMTSGTAMLTAAVAAANCFIIAKAVGAF